MTGIKTTQAARVAGKNGYSLISDEKFRELYAALLQCKMLDDRLRTASTHTYERWPGREAGTAGVFACLHPGDSVTATPRGVLAAYLQNGSLAQRGQSASVPIAQIASATGDALRHKLEKLNGIAVVFAGTDEPNRMREIFTVAAHLSLPVFYILEGRVSVTGICGTVPVIRVDGSDAVAVYRVAHESVARAREGGGPTIMECVQWPGEGEAEDPLTKLERYLAGKKLFRREWKQRLEKKYGRALDQSVETFRLNRF